MAETENIQELRTALAKAIAQRDVLSKEIVGIDG